MFCRSCGKEIPEGKFCVHCGAAAPGLEDGRSDTLETGENLSNKKKSKKSKTKKPINKKLLVILLSIAAVVIGAVVALFLIFGLKSDINKVFAAATKTLFNSSNFTLEIREDGENILQGKFVLGEDIKNTKVSLEYEDGEKGGLIDGNVYIPYDGNYSFDEALDHYEESFEYYDVDFDAKNVLNNLLTEKIDEKEFEKVYDDILKKFLERLIEDECGESVTLPTYKKTIKYIEKFLDKCVDDGAIKVSKTKVSNGKEYKIEVDTEKVLKSLIDFCKGEKELDSIMRALDWYDLLESNIERGYLEDFEITATVDKKGYLTEARYKDKWKTFKIAFSDIDSTEIGKDEIEEIKEWSEKEWTYYDPYYDPYYSEPYYNGSYYDDPYYDDPYYDDDLYYDDPYYETTTYYSDYAY